MLSPQTDSLLFWIRKLKASTDIFHLSPSRISAHSFLSGIPRTRFRNLFLVWLSLLCTVNTIILMDINTITPGSQQDLSQLLFWLQAERAHRADLRLCLSPDFTFSSLIVWGSVYLSVNIFHFHSLIIWNIWLTVTKSTVWVTSGYLAIRCFLPFSHPPSLLFSPCYVVGLAINIYDREMIMWGSCFLVYG